MEAALRFAFGPVGTALATGALFAFCVACWRRRPNQRQAAIREPDNFEKPLALSRSRNRERDECSTEILRHRSGNESQNAAGTSERISLSDGQEDNRTKTDFSNSKNILRSSTETFRSTDYQEILSIDGQENQSDSYSEISQNFPISETRPNSAEISEFTRSLEIDERQNVSTEGIIYNQDFSTELARNAKHFGEYEKPKGETGYVSSDSPNNSNLHSHFLETQSDHSGESREISPFSSPIRKNQYLLQTFDSFVKKFPTKEDSGYHERPSVLSNSKHHSFFDVPKLSIDIEVTNPLMNSGSNISEKPITRAAIEICLKRALYTLLNKSSISNNKLGGESGTSSSSELKEVVPQSEITRMTGIKKIEIESYPNENQRFSKETTVSDAITKDSFLNAEERLNDEKNEIGENCQHEIKSELHNEEQFSLPMESDESLKSDDSTLCDSITVIDAEIPSLTIIDKLENELNYYEDNSLSMDVMEEFHEKKKVGHREAIMSIDEIPDSNSKTALHGNNAHQKECNEFGTIDAMTTNKMQNKNNVIFLDNFEKCSVKGISEPNVTFQPTSEPSDIIKCLDENNLNENLLATLKTHKLTSEKNILSDLPESKVEQILSQRELVSSGKSRNLVPFAAENEKQKFNKKTENNEKSRSSEKYPAKGIENAEKFSNGSVSERGTTTTVVDIRKEKKNANEINLRNSRKKLDKFQKRSLEKVRVLFARKTISKKRKPEKAALSRVPDTEGDGEKFDLRGGTGFQEALAGSQAEEFDGGAGKRAKDRKKAKLSLGLSLTLKLGGGKCSRVTAPDRDVKRAMTSRTRESTDDAGTDRRQQMDRRTGERRIETKVRTDGSVVSTAVVSRCSFDDRWDWDDSLTVRTVVSEETFRPTFEEFVASTTTREDRSEGVEYMASEQDRTARCNGKEHRTASVQGESKIEDIYVTDEHTESDAFTSDDAFRPLEKPDTTRDDLDRPTAGYNGYGATTNGGHDIAEDGTQLPDPLNPSSPRVRRLMGLLNRDEERRSRVRAGAPRDDEGEWDRILRDVLASVHELERLGGGRTRADVKDAEEQDDPPEHRQSDPGVEMEAEAPSSKGETPTKVKSLRFKLDPDVFDVPSDDSFYEDEEDIRPWRRPQQPRYKTFSALELGKSDEPVRLVSVQASVVPAGQKMVARPMGIDLRVRLTEDRQSKRAHMGTSPSQAKRRSPVSEGWCQELSPVTENVDWRENFTAVEEPKPIVPNGILKTPSPKIVPEDPKNPFKPDDGNKFEGSDAKDFLKSVVPDPPSNLNKIKEADGKPQKPKVPWKPPNLEKKPFVLPRKKFQPDPDAIERITGYKIALSKPPLPPPLIQKTSVLPMRINRAELARKQYLDSKAQLARGGIDGAQKFQKFLQQAQNDRARIVTSVPDLGAIEKAVIEQWAREKKGMSSTRESPAREDCKSSEVPSSSRGSTPDDAWTSYVQSCRQYFGRRSQSMSYLETDVDIVPNLEDDDKCRSVSALHEEVPTVPHDSDLDQSCEDLDDSGRAKSEHELRVERSLRSLPLPDWYKKSEKPKSGFILTSAKEKHGWAAAKSLASSTSSLASCGLRRPTTGRSLRSSREEIPWSSPDGPTLSLALAKAFREPYLGWRRARTPTSSGVSSSPRGVSPPSSWGAATTTDDDEVLNGEVSFDGEDAFGGRTSSFSEECNRKRMDPPSLDDTGADVATVSMDTGDPVKLPGGEDTCEDINNMSMDTCEMFDADDHVDDDIPSPTADTGDDIDNLSTDTTDNKDCKDITKDLSKDCCDATMSFSKEYNDTTKNSKEKTQDYSKNFSNGTKLSNDTNGDNSQNTTHDFSKNTSQDFSENISHDNSQNSSQDYSKETSRDYSKEASQDYSKNCIAKDPSNASKIKDRVKDSKLKDSSKLKRYSYSQSIYNSEWDDEEESRGDRKGVRSASPSPDGHKVIWIESSFVGSRTTTSIVVLPQDNKSVQSGNAIERPASR